MPVDFVGDAQSICTVFRGRDLELQNVEIIVADISTFEMEASYDRIFSIEMFEVQSNLSSTNYWWSG